MNLMFVCLILLLASSLADREGFLYFIDELLHGYHGDALSDQFQRQIFQFAEAHTGLTDIIAFSGGTIAATLRSDRSSL